MPMPTWRAVDDAQQPVLGTETVTKFLFHDHEVNRSVSLLGWRTALSWLLPPGDQASVSPNMDKLGTRSDRSIPVNHMHGVVQAQLKQTTPHVVHLPPQGLPHGFKRHDVMVYRYVLAMAQ